MNESERVFWKKKRNEKKKKNKNYVTSTRLHARRRDSSRRRRVSSVRSVFRARIVFDFRPIKVDSAHRPVLRGADTPGGPVICRVDQKPSVAEAESAISRSRSLSRPPRLVSPRDSEKYYLSASWHINSPYAMIIKVSRDTVSGRRSIYSGGAAVYTGCPAKGEGALSPPRIWNLFSINTISFQML